MNNKGTDQTAWMCRLICAFVVRIGIKRFSHDVAHLISQYLQGRNYRKNKLPRKFCTSINCMSKGKQTRKFITAKWYAINNTRKLVVAKINRFTVWNNIERPHDKNNKLTCLPSHGILPVWSVPVHIVLDYPLSAQWKLIKLGRCPDWSKSSLAHSHLLVLSWGSSISVLSHCMLLLH